MSKTVVKGPEPVKRNKVLLKLREKGKATSHELKVTTSFMDSLVRKEIVKIAGKAEPRGKSKKGRKSNVYSLTRTGSGKAQALVRAKAAKSQTAITA